MAVSQTSTFGAIKFERSLQGNADGEGGNRTHDTTIFSRVLYQLSYLAVADARDGRAAEG
jgi:hypothetical protein